MLFNQPADFCKRTGLSKGLTAKKGDAIYAWLLFKNLFGEDYAIDG